MQSFDDAEYPFQIKLRFFIFAMIRRSQLSLTLLKLKFLIFFPHKPSTFHWSFSTNHQLHTSISNNLLQSKDSTAIATALTLSSKSKSLVLGKITHTHIFKLGFSREMFSLNNLIVMYSKCEDLSCGMKVFDEMPERNLVSWTSIISGCIQNGESAMGLEIFVEMIRYGFLPNEFAFGSVLRGCASLEDIDFGSSVHCFALKLGNENNYFVTSSVIHMYAKCGCIEASEQAFESVENDDVGCWNSLIGGYALNGHSIQALKLVSKMKKSGATMDQFTFMSAIKGCSISGDAEFGRQIHGMIIRSEVVFSSSGMNSLVDMYFKIGRKDSAMKVFNKMLQKDVISWNTVFSEFAQDGSARELVSLFTKMLRTGLKPNYITFSIMFRLCGLLTDLSLGFQFYCLAYHFGFVNEVLVANSLINMFSRCASFDIAHMVFSSIPVKNITSWNEMILGYNLNGCTAEALKLFSSLWDLGVQVDEVTFSAILSACSAMEQLEIARQIHGSIIKSGFGFHGFVISSLINTYGRSGETADSFKVFNGIERLDMVSCGAMISAFVHGNCNYEALELLKCLIEDGEKPDEFILGSVLNGCANITAYQQTKSIHSRVIKTGFEKHVCVASAVIDSYAKCGDIESSKMAFDQSSRYDDAVLLNTMIMGFALHGLLMEAIEIFEKMKLANLQPSHATFVSVITMCSHLGLVHQGHKFFDSISLIHGMVPSAANYGCLIDLFSRNGFLEEATDVIETMPFEPWPAVWRSFLSGCRIHGNIELGEWASKQLLLLVPESDAAYVLLSRVYSEEGSWVDAAKVRRKMKERGVRKEPGCSWIET